MLHGSLLMAQESPAAAPVPPRVGGAVVQGGGGPRAPAPCIAMCCATRGKVYDPPKTIIIDFG